MSEVFYVPGKCECCGKFTEGDFCETCFQWDSYMLQFAPVPLKPARIPAGYFIRRNGRVIVPGKRAA